MTAPHIVDPAGLLGVSRAGYYRWLAHRDRPASAGSAQQLRDDLDAMILAHHKESEGTGCLYRLSGPHGGVSVLRSGYGQGYPAGLGSLGDAAPVEWTLDDRE